jgi:hypothetical protein
MYLKLGAWAFGLILTCPAVQAQVQPRVSIVVEQLTSVGTLAGYTTYGVAMAVDTAAVLDVYSVFGQAGHPLVIPPAFQVETPFGTNIGPANPAVFGRRPE